jgi:hypothetical protein
MKFNIKYALEIIVYFIIIIKIMFLISTLGVLLFSFYKKDSTTSKMFQEQFSYWKHVTEFIFMASMALLLLFIFSPWHKHHHKVYITEDLVFLFFLFGCIILITLDWSLFFTESKVFKALQRDVD